MQVVGSTMFSTMKWVSVVLSLAAVASAQNAIADLQQDSLATLASAQSAITHLQHDSLAAVASAQNAITDLQHDPNHVGGGSSSSNAVAVSKPIEWAPAAPVSAALVPQAAYPAASTPQQAFAQPFSSVAPAPAPAANAMSSLLTTSSGQGTQAVGPDSIAVVGGLVEAFLHKVQLEPGEKSCLENNVGQLTGDIMGTVGDVVTAVKALIAGKGTIAKKSSGTLISAGMDSAVKITSLVTLATQLVKSCVHADTLTFLKTTAQHLKNTSYLEDRFLVNGVDIAHSLADSVVAFEAQDFHRFGADIGVSLRKILLSNAQNSTRTMLPEGMPEQVIIQKATDGLMKGFFVSGSAFEITDTAHPNLDIVIDLHQCIAGNSVFFKGLWMAAWDLVAQLSANGKQHGLGVTQPQQGRPKWSSELMMAMMQFPSALVKCGVGQDSQTMLLEAIQSIQDVKVQFKFPADGSEGSAAEVAEGATNSMAKAVEAWTNWDFETFGLEIGKLFRELVLLALPQKYSVDPNGRLQLAAQTHKLRTGAQPGSVYVSFVVIGSCALSLVFALAACRVRSKHQAQAYSQTPARDIEAADVADAAE